MRLEWLRAKNELKEVLHDPKAPGGPDIAYWVYSDISASRWHDMTILPPGTYGKEFVKTYGHYHTPRVLETYKLVSGEGLFILQKKHVSNGRWMPEVIDEIYMIKPSLKEEIVVPFEFGHVWVNIGDTPLITFDDWTSGHTETDYEAIKKLKGMCFYILNENGIKFVPNKNYKTNPNPRIITVKEFQKLYPINY